LVVLVAAAAVSVIAAPTAALAFTGTHPGSSKREQRPLPGRAGAEHPTHGGSMKRRLTVVTLLALLASTFMVGDEAHASPSNADAQQHDQLVALERLHQIVDNDPARFAGISTNGSGEATVHLLDAPAAAQPDLREIRQATSAAGIKLTVVTERRSLDDLTRIQRAVLSDRQLAAVESAHVIGARIDPATNSVVVRATGDTAALVSIAGHTYGDAVRVQASQELFTAYGRFNDTSPLYGGDRIGNTDAYCTYGFSLTNLNGVHYGITAGHCWDLGAWVDVTRSSGGTNNWGAGYDSFGTVQVRSFGNGLLDDELVGGRDYGGRIWISNNLLDNNNTSAPVHDARASCGGCNVYFNGSFTGRSLAHVVAYEGCANVNDHGVLVNDCGMWSATSANGQRICQSGDSGGPVFAFDGRGGVTAVGIITACSPNGLTGFYTDIPQILSNWGSTITTG
jgi:hypothetical protein